jgi:hypothetical protein
MRLHVATKPSSNQWGLSRIVRPARVGEWPARDVRAVMDLLRASMRRFRRRRSGEHHYAIGGRGYNW